MMATPYMSLKPSVGTMNRSAAAMASLWFSMKVFQVWPRGLGCRQRQLLTVDWASSDPSFKSSPWIRGAPHSGFSTAIRRIRLRSSLSTGGRPPTEPDFQRQKARNPSRCRRTKVSGFTIKMASATPGTIRDSQPRMTRSRPRNLIRPRCFRLSTRI
jgi:hypothetical protein